jgi:hypothetical protein
VTLLLLYLEFYYPTYPLILHHIIEIATHLNNYENDNCLKMFPWSLNFFNTEILMLHPFAFILYPRAKMRGFNNVL